MNLLLLDPSERPEPGVARVTGRKARHLRRVLGKAVGDTVRVGELDGAMGEGTVERIEDDAVWLRYVADRPPPPPSPVRLVLALPRPPMLRRVLQGVTAMGVKQVVLLHAARVEKSFWGSHAVQPAVIDEQLRLGLEQGRDTVRPRVQLRRRFRPFVEDELRDWAGPGRWLVAEPAPDAVEATPSIEPTTVAVGPEGGWVPFELELLSAQGFGAVTLGPRALRVETAVIALVARLSG